MEIVAAPETGLRKPAIYSPQAMLGFSTLVNPLMGGWLAFISLRRVGQISAAWSALCASANFWVFTLLVSSSLRWGSLFAAGLGYVWGRWLNRYIGRKLPAAASYPPENVLGPLFLALSIGMALSIIKRLLLYY